jgi:hypothetical protein
VTPRLANPPPANAANSTKSNDGTVARCNRADGTADNQKSKTTIGDERPLAHFAALPVEWRRLVLRRSGGSGDETIEALQLALSPHPTTTHLMTIAADIEARRWNGRKARPLTPRQESLVAQAADDAWQYLNDLDLWESCQHLKILAAEVARRTAKLEHVDDDGLRLLTANDSDLLSLAEKRAEMARRRPGAHPRDQDKFSVLRRLRVKVNRATLHAAGILGLIGGPKNLQLPPYADDWTCRRFRDQRETNRAFLRKFDMVRTDTADVVSLVDIAASKEKARRAMWYALVLGVRDIAKRDRLEPIFVTATLPGLWHLHPESGNPGDPQYSPADGSIEIGKRWHRVLCLFRRRGGRIIGIRVAEPHADGTVHLHLVLWLSSERVDSFCACLDQHFPATTNMEMAARQNNDFTQGPALVVRRWEERPQDDRRGNADAASYALNYVLDVLGDPGGSNRIVETEHEAGRENGCDQQGTQQVRVADKNSERVAAWARHLRCRRLSLVGLAPGTIERWTKIYAEMKAADREGRQIEEPRARSVAHAMRRNQWATALRLLGAFSPLRHPRLVALRESGKNRWGDCIKKTTAFFHPRTGEISSLMRPYKWSMRKHEEPNPLDDESVSIIHSYPRSGAAVGPRAPP